MITKLPNGDIELDVSDWTREMEVLANRLGELPLLADRHPNERTHELGIDELSRKRFGYIAIQLLHEHASELNYCPDHGEVVSLGEALVKVCCEVELVRRTHPSSTPPKMGDIIRLPNGETMMWDGTRWLEEHKRRHKPRQQKPAPTPSQPARKNKFTRG